MASHPLLIETVPIDDYCVGDRWSAVDQSELAALVAIVAMGQATQAAHILSTLIPASPAFENVDLQREARIRLTVQDDDTRPRYGYPKEQRDGFIFEVISWIAARQAYGEHALIKDPHINSTSQGLDGLMLELTADKSSVTMTTIFEDKCTVNPRVTFRDKVIQGFLQRHTNDRSAEVVATASVLLTSAGITLDKAAKLAEAVMNRAFRRYRASFALPAKADSQRARARIFKGYDALEGITASQRVGASLIVTGKMRDWFAELAGKAIDYLDELQWKGN